MRLVSLLLFFFLPLSADFSAEESLYSELRPRDGGRPKLETPGPRKKLPMVNIALTAIFRDEARFLKEWIEYHRLIGVERFYLTNHLSVDNYLEVLQPYIDQGIVDLREERSDTDLFLSWNKIQLNSYSIALTKARDEAKWVIVIDTDEFVVPKGQPLSTILKNSEKFGGIAINWQIFGTSYVEKIPEGKLLIETLLLKAPKEFHENHYYKLIVQPKHVGKFMTPHYCRFNPPYSGCDMGGNGLNGNMSPKIHTDLIQINHYWTRDEDFYVNVKVARKKRMGPWFPTMEKKHRRVQPRDRLLHRSLCARTTCSNGF